jgi:hypothetical protein
VKKPKDAFTEIERIVVEYGLSDVLHALHVLMLRETARLATEAQQQYQRGYEDGRAAGTPHDVLDMS